MNHITAFSAAALLATPICMVAQAGTVEEFTSLSFELLDSMTGVLEKVTAANADACIAELDALAPKAAKLKEVTNKLTPEEQQHLDNNEELKQKMMAAMQRLIGATMKLQASAQTASPEERAKIAAVLTKMQSVMGQ